MEPINQWDVHLISDVLSYARVLYYSGKKERAVDLFNRWFEGLTVLNLWAVLKDKGMLDTRNQDYIMISTEAKEISDDLGKLICWSKQYSMLEKESEWNDEITVFMRGLCESFWHESVLNYKDKELETALISISHIAVRPNVLIDILIELIEELKFSSISIIEKVNRDVLVHSKLGLIFDLFMRIVSGNIEKYDKYEREEVYNKIQEAYIICCIFIQNYGKSLFCAQRKEPLMAEQTPDSIITTQRNGQTIVAELFFNHSSTETFRDKLLKLVLADSSRLSASDGQEPEKTEILR